jgi:hypothetical protein
MPVSDKPFADTHFIDRADSHNAFETPFVDVDTCYRSARDHGIKFIGRYLTAAVLRALPRLWRIHAPESNASTMYIERVPVYDGRLPDQLIGEGWCA